VLFVVDDDNDNDDGISIPTVVPVPVVVSTLAFSCSDSFGRGCGSDFISSEHKEDKVGGQEGSTYTCHYY